MSGLKPKQTFHEINCNQQNTWGCASRHIIEITGIGIPRTQVYS